MLLRNYGVGVALLAISVSLLLLRDVLAEVAPPLRRLRGTVTVLGATSFVALAVVVAMRFVVVRL